MISFVRNTKYEKKLFVVRVPENSLSSPEPVYSLAVKRRNLISTTFLITLSTYSLWIGFETRPSHSIFTFPKVRFKEINQNYIIYFDLLIAFNLLIYLKCNNVFFIPTLQKNKQSLLLVIIFLTRRLKNFKFS